MPFGDKCQYAEFSDCVRAYKGKVANPEAYCAKLQKVTEEHCKRVSRLNGTRAQGGNAPGGRRPWSFDDQTGRYSDADGNVLSDADVRDLLARFLEVQRERVASVTETFVEGRLSVPEWETEMRSLIKDTFGASYLLGRGGRNMMDFRDWGRLGAMTRRQYAFLNAFAADVAGGGQSRAQTLQRANLYALAARAAEQRAAVLTLGAPDLPAYPGDGTTECLTNCVPAETLVESPTIQTGYRRWYEGPMVRLRTASGRELTISPNHPVLTGRGWVGAGAVVIGDSLIRATLNHDLPRTNPYVEDAPAPIGQIFEAVRRANGRVAERRMGSAVDFHGDGGDGKIDVVGTDGLLRDHGYPAGLNPLLEDALLRAHVLGHPGLLGPRSSYQIGFGLRAAAHGVVGGRSQSRPFCRRHSAHAQQRGFASGARLYAFGEQSFTNRHAVDAERTAEREFAFSGSVAFDQVRPGEVLNPSWGAAARPVLAEFNPGFEQAIADGCGLAADILGDTRHWLAGPIASDQIVHIEREPFRGHVYNLATATDWYVAEGLIVHNCKCYWSLERTTLANGAAGWNATWVDEPGPTECPDCVRRSGEWNPLQVAGAT